MENKYEITDICHKRNGVTLHKIRAIRDFGDVKTGDYGGWVEHEGNLSQLGDCWVCDEAMVCDEARVCDEAVVCCEAVITQSEEYMAIFPIGSRNDCTTFFKTAGFGISVHCGCFRGTIDEFALAVEETHGDNKHGRAYCKAIELAKLQITGGNDDDRKDNFTA